MIRPQALFTNRAWGRDQAVGSGSRTIWVLRCTVCLWRGHQMCLAGRKVLSAASEPGAAGSIVALAAEAVAPASGPALMSVASALEAALQASSGKWCRRVQYNLFHLQCDWDSPPRHSHQQSAPCSYKCALPEEADRNKWHSRPEPEAMRRVLSPIHSRAELSPCPLSLPQ